MAVNEQMAQLPVYKALGSYVKAAAAAGAQGDGQARALDDAVEKLKDLAKAAESGLEDFLWDAYNAIFAVARETAPEDQRPLVELVRRLRETTVTASDGQPLHIAEDGVVWKDLPQFGWVARDLWNFDIRDASMSKEEKESYINLTSFLAQLTAHAADRQKDPRNDPLDYSMYALWTLRDLFENDRAENADADDAAVKQAYQWIRYSGDVLRRLSAEDSKLSERTGVAGARFDGREWKGFNEERWAVWTEGFAAAQASLSDAQAKEAAGHAVEMMKSK